MSPRHGPRSDGPRSDGLRSDGLRELVGTGDPAWSSSRESALVESILSRTTRAAGAEGAPPGLSGDLRLVGEFLLERFRASRALRVAAAASLVLHVAAVPVLAWWLLETDDDAPLLRFEPALQDPFADAPVEPPRDLEFPEDWDELGAGEGAGHAVEDARRLARFLLAREGAPALEGDHDSGPLGALARRIELINGEARGLTDVASETWRTALPIERCVWAETSLDAYVLRKDLPAWWADVEGDLRLLAAQDGALAELAASTLARGEAYGAWSWAMQAPGGTADARAAWSGAPFRREWTDALRAALTRQGSVPPALDTWLRAASESRH